MPILPLPKDKRQLLVGKHTSRQNKLWIIADWKYFQPWYVEYKWAGEPMRSRMLFQFGPNEPWVEAKSFDEDVMPTFKFGKDKGGKEQ
jgi:hypothetical protein